MNNNTMYSATNLTKTGNVENFTDDVNIFDNKTMLTTPNINNVAINKCKDGPQIEIKLIFD